MDAHCAADAYRAWLDTLDFDGDGYITAIIQDRRTRDILTLSRMNRESLERTLATGRTWLHSKRQRRLLHRSADSAAFRPVVEVLESEDGDTLVFYVDRIAGAGPESMHFRPALVRDEDEPGVASMADLATLVTELSQIFLLVGHRLRVLPVGLEHTFRSLRTMLREAERSVQINQDRLRNNVAALIARLLIFAAARGLVFQELMVAVQEQMVAQALTNTSGSLSEECH